MRLVGAGALLVGGLADAADRRQRAVDQPDHLADPNLVRALGEPVAAELAALALDQSGVLERLEDLFEKLDRQLLALGQLRGLDQIAALGGKTEVDQRSESILSPFGKLHTSL